MRECFCFGSEAVRGLVKSRVEFTRGFAARKFFAGFAREKYGGLARSRIPPATQATCNMALTLRATIRFIKFKKVRIVIQNRSAA